MAEKNGRGLDRREFLRRSAIVGGTVAWMTPVIQSLAPPAFAHVTSPNGCGCCECLAGNSFENKCETEAELKGCTTTPQTVEDCAQLCSTNTFPGGKAYCFHKGPNAMSCGEAGCSAH
jgi:hypothetical protein